MTHISTACYAAALISNVRVSVFLPACLPALCVPADLSVYLSVWLSVCPSHLHAATLPMQLMHKFHFKT